MEERTTYSELKCREVVNLMDGARLGHICDLELDLCTGQLTAIMVPNECRCFGLIKSRDNTIIPFPCIKKFGEDVILVEIRRPI